MLGLVLSGSAINAQDFDSKPVININNAKEDLNFTIGARFMADGAYYSTGAAELRSGVAITDARIRTSMTYQDWYFYADFDFSRGRFAQKNIFLQYSLQGEKGTHRIKAGYYNNPNSMANNTSRGSLHFISRSAASNALSAGRELGVSYIFYNNAFFANQGIFVENEYNDQIAGRQGASMGGRWLWRPIRGGRSTLHVGATLRYANIATGELTDEGVLKTNLNVGSSLETYVDSDKSMLSASVPWAKHVYDMGAEFLFHNRDWFVRGEYLFKYVTKQRDDATLFSVHEDEWESLEAWRTANPLDDNSFHGAYVEAGYKIFGGDYKYSNSDGVLKGLDGKSLEVVARYSYAGLNDLNDGERYSSEKGQYYAVGSEAGDGSETSLSIGGGNLHLATVGVNYSFNKFAQVLLSYSFGRLCNDRYPESKNISVLQTRLMFQF